MCHYNEAICCTVCILYHSLVSDFVYVSVCVCFPLFVCFYMFLICLLFQAAGNLEPMRDNKVFLCAPASLEKSAEGENEAPHKVTSLRFHFL